jgi:hypothetical protein
MTRCTRSTAFRPAVLRTSPPGNFEDIIHPAFYTIRLFLFPVQLQHGEVDSSHLTRSSIHAKGAPIHYCLPLLRCCPSSRPCSTSGFSTPSRSPPAGSARAWHMPTRPRCGPWWATSWAWETGTGRTSCWIAGPGTVCTSTSAASLTRDCN